MKKTRILTVIATLAISSALLFSCNDRKNSSVSNGTNSSRISDTIEHSKGERSIETDIRSVYSLGETIDLSNSYVVISIDKVERERLPFTSAGIEVDGIDTETVGEKEIIVRYQGNKKTIPYRVVENVVTFKLRGGEYKGSGDEFQISLYNNYVSLSDIHPVKKDEEGNELAFAGWFYDEELTQHAAYPRDEEFHSSSSVTLYASYSTNYSNRYSYSINNSDHTAVLNGIREDQDILDTLLFLDELVIPSEIEGYPIVEIAPYFLNDTIKRFRNVSKISFEPDSQVKKIGDYAFYGPIGWFGNSLAEVELPSSLEEIGNYAFSTTGFNKIFIPKNVVKIGDGAFEYNTNRIEVEFEEGSKLKSIGNDCFKRCSRLETIELPDGLSEIGSGAFENCNEINEIRLPASVSIIGASSFKLMDSLKSIDVDSNNPFYVSIDGNLYNKAKTKLIRYCYGSNKTDFVLPSSVKTIGDSAFNVFNSYTNLASVTLNEGLTYIEKEAFSGCTFSFTLPKSLNSFALGAFLGYAGERIEISPENTKYCEIDGVLCSKDKKSIFACPTNTKLHDFVLLDSIERICEYAFAFINTRHSFTVPSTSKLSEIRQDGLLIASFKNLAVFDYQKEACPSFTLESIFDSKDGNYTYVSDYDGILLFKYDQPMKQFQDVFSQIEDKFDIRFSFNVYSAAEIVSDVKQELEQFGFTDYNYYRSTGETYIFNYLSPLAQNKNRNKLYAIYKDKLASKSEQNYFAKIEQCFCYSFYEQYVLPNQISSVSLDLYNIFCNRYEVAPTEVKTAVSSIFKQISSALTLPLNDVEIGTLYDKILNFPLSADTFDKDAYDQLNTEVEVNYLNNRSLPNAVNQKLIFLHISNLIYSVLSIKDYTHENVNYIYRVMTPSDLNGYSQGLPELIQRSCYSDEKKQRIYHYNEFQAFLTQFNDPTDGIYIKDYQKRKEERRNFSFDSKDYNSASDFFDKVAANLYSHFYAQICKDSVTDGFDYPGAIKTLEVELNIDMFLNDYQEITEDNFASALDLVDAVEDSLPYVSDSNEIIGYSAYQTKKGILKQFTDNYSAILKSKINAFYNAIPKKETKPDPVFNSFRDLYDSFALLGGHSTELLEGDTDDGIGYEERFNICFSSYLIHYLLSYRDRNSNTNIPETENVEFKKVYFGYYDFSQGKKVEGIQSYLDEAIQEVDPSNCGKIYQYDAYLKLVNSLNGGSGDSDL